jgi:hypothetical protein
MAPGDAGPQELAHVFECTDDLAPVGVQLEQVAVGVGEGGEEIAALGLEADSLREGEVGRHAVGHQGSAEAG